MKFSSASINNAYSTYAYSTYACMNLYLEIYMHVYTYTYGNENTRLNIQAFRQMFESKNITVLKNLDVAP